MAKKFSFKLESVLRYRQMLEEGKKREFALANMEVEEQKRKAEELAEQRHSLQDELREMNSGGEIPFNQMLDTIKYISGLDMGIMSARREEERLRQQMEGKRLAFIEAQRDKKAIEILKEKKVDEYNAEFEHERQLVLDELSLRMLHKKKTEEQVLKAYKVKKEMIDG